MGTTNDRRLLRIAVVAAIAIGVGVGSYGIAAAASGGSATGSSSGPATAPSTPAQSPGGPPWGHARDDETALTGDTAAKVRAAAEAKVPGGTVVRVETDADGHAAYEAHMTKADGTPVTVYVDEQFEVVGVESR
ncbi:MAG TPA: PepSY domain-containing protein [Gaiellaceae bacterium]|nr:PepSY domain-containing protein [Gaiellaceae bacterium]